MRKLYFLFCFLLVGHTAVAQELHINWNRFIGGDGSCPAQVRYSIPTSDKGILFAGITNCIDKGDMPPFPYTGINAFVGKLDSNQQLSWLKTIGGSSSDIADALFEFPNGDYGVGVTTVSGSFLNYHGADDILLMRLDINGNVLFQKCYGSDYSEQIFSAIPSTENGFVTFASSSGYGDDVPSHYGSLQFWYDWWLFKTDSAGDIIWSKNFGGSEDESGFGSILSVGDYYYVFGCAESKDHDCLDTSWHSASVNTGYDFFLLKLDTAGNLIWSKSYGGSAYEQAGKAIFDDRDSTIVLTGESHSNDYMGAGNHGAIDASVIKVDLEGNVLWHRMLGFTSEERGKSICKGADKGYFILSNVFHGTIGSQDGWMAYIDSNGNIVTDKIFGSVKYESVASIHPYLNGYVATGSSEAPSFTVGTNIGHQGEGPAAFSFITYFDYWPLKISNIDAEKNKITIHPNPSNGYIRVSVPKGNGDIIVTDMAGKKVFEKRNTNKELLIDTKDWNKGIFLLRWESENGEVLTEKMVNN